MPTNWNEVRHELDKPANYGDIVNTPWFSDALYEKFSDGEYARRHAAARELMRREGVDALLLTGSQNIYSMGSGVTWGCGLIDARGMCQYLLLPRDGEATLIYPHDGTHLEAVRQQVSVTDVRSSREYGKAIAQRLRELGITSGRIGVTAADRNGPEFMGVRAYLQLRAELPDVELTFLPDAMHELTYRKGAEEIGAMRKAGTITVAAQDAIAEAARPGVVEYALAAASTKAMLERGAQVFLMMIGSTSMHDPRIMYPNPNPSARVLSEGDIIQTEISASYLGYSAKLGHPVVLGEPPQEMVDFHRDVTYAGFKAIKEALGPGVPLTHLAKVSNVYRDAGHQSRPMTLHGIDMITAGPKVMVNATNAKDYDDTLVEGMVVNIESNPIHADGVWGSFLSRTFAITADGVDDLTPTPYPLDELLVVS